MNLSSRAAEVIRRGTTTATDKLPYAVLSCPRKDEFGRWVAGTGQCPHRRHATFEDAADCAAAIYEEFERGSIKFRSIEIVEPMRFRWQMKRRGRR